MILLCTILQVVNGKSFFNEQHQSTDGSLRRESHERHIRVIRQAGIFDSIRMKCPIGMSDVEGTCRTIIYKQ